MSMKQPTRLIAALILSTLSALGQSTAPPRIVYVAEFVSDSLVDDEKLVSFTELFEEGLDGGRFRILDRREFDRILGERNREKKVRSVQDMSEGTRSALKVTGANGVFFGSVTDDKDSGTLRVAVRLEGFDSEIHCRASTVMNRGKLFDFDAREALMKRLAEQICNNQTMAERPVGAVAALIPGFKPNPGPGPRSDQQIVTVKDTSSPLMQGVLGTWFTKADGHPDPLRPAFRLRVNESITFARNGAFNVSFEVHPGVDNSWESTCMGEGAGDWQLNQRTLTYRLQNINFKLVIVSKNGIILRPEEAKAQGYSCDMLSTLIPVGFTSEDDIFDITAGEMHTKTTDSNGKTETTTYTRTRQ
jgi:hypothetical protein